MSSSTKPRIKRGTPPDKRIRRRRYREDSLPELTRDFESRCAYSMQHEVRAGQMEVDHFDPRRKDDLVQDYANLFLVSRHCNSKKAQHWPTREELAVGCRFLNPCEEMDYGAQIFEDPVTHKLVGTAPAAIWHIRMCGLNADHLVRERAHRTEYSQLLRDKAVHIRKDVFEVGEMVRALAAEVGLMINEIPFSPVGFRPGQGC